MSNLVDAGLMQHDEGFAASKKVFETKEEFLSAIILSNIYSFEFGYKFDLTFIDDFYFETEINKYDIDLELEVITDGFLRSCICQGWEDYDTDGQRQHFEQCDSGKGGGSPAWLYSYYDKAVLEDIKKKEARMAER